MIPTLILRYVPSIQSIPLEQGMTWEPTYKALPTHGWVAAHLKSTAKRIIKSVHTSLAYELSVFTDYDSCSWATVVPRMFVAALHSVCFGSEQ